MNGVEIVRGIGNDVDMLLKDIPIEHIVNGVQMYNRAYFVRYFKGYRLQVSGRKRVRELVDREIAEKGSEELAQLLFTLWNRANGRLYHAIYNKVRSINEQVDKIEKIEDPKAAEFLDELLTQFDKDRLFLCILINEVRMSPEVLKEKLGKDVPLAEWPPAPEPDPAAEEEGAVAAPEDARPGPEA
jgi:hypothetical protein